MAEKKELTHYIEGSGGRQEGSATLIKEKEQRGRGIEDEGQKQGSGAQYPWSAPGSMEDCRELWCDGKRQLEYR